MDAIDNMRAGCFRLAYVCIHPEELSRTVNRKLAQVFCRFDDLNEANKEAHITPPSEYLTWDQYDEIAQMLRDLDL